MVNRVKAPRDRQRPLQVYVNDAERAVLIEQAKRHNLSSSAYLRTAGLGLSMGVTVTKVEQLRRQVRP